MHLVFGDGLPDCTKCEGEPRLRAEYGCDGESPCPCGGAYDRCRTCEGTGKRVVFSVSCGCLAGCERCSGKGELPMFRCPGKLTAARPDVRAAFWACRQYEDHGVMPAAGGLSDQSQGFLDYLRIYQHERGLIEKERRAQAERDAKRQGAKGR